ncbi:unnamed protein product [Spirodela intermedia]|uniref:Uncharacterized protein n=2 Tax=Spirodela intermedia TaxID=51605 RepID=A0A7I8IG18_SPIIN|nr:unnamed protein product [Spirodela intermedia]CAA6656234.1 unnamed protein product [Spirodela intermedia]CAA7391722.1 unnamed protein product [Spirodela intermedia]
MQGGRPGRDSFSGFGDPFAGFGGLRMHGSLISSIFGGRDPFDDPFFTQPFGAMMGPNLLGQSMFGARGNPFGDLTYGGFLEDPAPRPKRSRGPIIEELPSDDEEQNGTDGFEKEENARKRYSLGKEPYIEEPEEEMKGKKISHVWQGMEYKRTSSSKPQTSTYSFHSSTVTYSGPGGAYYTASTTRRTGGDGVTVEENKEADKTKGKATHRIFRGLGDKGHSVTRKLNSDERVNTVQTLHNLNEDELAGFAEAWKGSAKRHLPGWDQSLDMLHDGTRETQTCNIILTRRPTTSSHWNFRSLKSASIKASSGKTL